jgi:hypothetical protein
MTAIPSPIPSFRLHKPTSQAIVRLNGHDFYLGKYVSEMSHEVYWRRIGEWLAGNPPSAMIASPMARPSANWTTFATL